MLTSGAVPGTNALPALTLVSPVIGLGTMSRPPGVALAAGGAIPSSRAPPVTTWAETGVAKVRQRAKILARIVWSPREMISRQRAKHRIVHCCQRTPLAQRVRAVPLGALRDPTKNSRTTLSLSAGQSGSDCGAIAEHGEGSIAGHADLDRSHGGNLATAWRPVWSRLAGGVAKSGRMFLNPQPPRSRMRCGRYAPKVIRGHTL